ncbi:putative disease resistance protein [Camellia lanceoleosa]|uniref:Disease resistance protein n=1 Tax=Camellia lanceoleosa TaxID=1840588 RepID=A0ACC0IUC6_9ERIC|nr:putative disease resistance protein [Camellia lanceoleosa]
MHCLKILDLSNTYILYLPESMSNLVNLHALLLVNCVCLEYVPSLVKPKALKELKLSRSPIREVPQGMEELVNLRNLDLSFNKSLHMLPCWTLCRVSQLQILRIEGSGAFVSAQEVFGYLRQLKVLGAQFLNVQELASFVTSQQCQALENYRLIVGNNFEYINKSVGKEVHAISFDSKPFGIGVDSLVLPSNIEYFGITRCEDLISLSDILSLRDAGHLRICLLQYSNGIESIFSSSSVSEDCQIPLRIVEELRLLDLPRFRVLVDGVVPPHNISFNLKKLYFYRCSSVKNIFPAMLQKFPNLEELTVPDCENVEDIIVEVEMRYQGHHQDDSNTITLRNLKSLRLGKLPILKNIYKGIMVCESLQDILVHSCPMLRRLPLSFHMNSGHASAPPGQHIRGDRVVGISAMG